MMLTRQSSLSTYWSATKKYFEDRPEVVTTLKYTSLSVSACAACFLIPNPTLSGAILNGLSALAYDVISSTEEQEKRSWKQWIAGSAASSTVGAIASTVFGKGVIHMFTPLVTMPISRYVIESPLLKNWDNSQPHFLLN